MLRYATKAVVLLFALALSALSGWAQVTTATLYGIVTDPSGAVLPGAEVTITHEGTSEPRHAVTGETGEFVLTNLPVGSYTVKIALAGFKTSQTTGIVLAAGQNARQRFSLELGALAETLNVAGSSPLVNTVSAEQRESLSSSQVTELPLSRRNVTSMLRLAAGADVGNGSVRIKLNHVNLGGFNTNLDRVDFGRITGAGGMRSMQMGLRLRF
jgi:hypothetical protein